jgi:TolB-like protein
VQLIEADTDRHVWAETYDRPTVDILSLQDDVARQIAREVDTALALPIAVTDRAS